MSDFLLFLGRFHVLLLHLPIGILLLAVLLEVASRRERFAHLAPAVNAVWLLGAASGVVTAALGYLHAREGGFDGAAVEAHRIAGTSLAALAAVTWLLRTRLRNVYARAWPVCVAAVVGAMLLTGHYGGNLTHGDTYLAQYAPAPLRPWMGIAEEDLPRARPVDVASADLYLDVVAPALRQRCGSCHNDGKRKGGLSVASHASLMKGGEHGPVVVAGDAKHSDLVRRISLEPTHEDFMPRDGKTPLSAAQSAAIRWWIQSGAPRTAPIATLHAPPELRASLATALDLAGAAQAAAAPAGTLAQPAANVGPPRPGAAAVRVLDTPAVPLPGAPGRPLPDASAVPMPDAAVVDSLERKGFVVRAIAIGSPLVHVDYTAGRPLAAADIAALAQIAPQVHTLNLRAAGVTDAQLEALRSFANLAHLRLELNPITDAGLAHLASLGKLEHLNLYGTKVGNAGISALATLPSLRELYVWQTAVTPTAVAELGRTHASLHIHHGFDASTFPEGPKAIPVVN